MVGRLGGLIYCMWASPLLLEGFSHHFITWLLPFCGKSATGDGWKCQKCIWASSSSQRRWFSVKVVQASQTFPPETHFFPDITCDKKGKGIWKHIFVQNVIVFSISTIFCSRNYSFGSNYEAKLTWIVLDAFRPQEPFPGTLVFRGFFFSAPFILTAGTRGQSCQV